MTALPHRERLAQSGAVSFPRPRHGPLGHLAGAVWWLVWAVWWFAAGLMIGWELTPGAPPT